ncbi:YkvA family protein [Fibrella sp. WM1]|uniref:YkvA family protein n=1 Tax=Fibrella musci TaxID=3242485 RepID=UPI003521F862
MAKSSLIAKVLSSIFFRRSTRRAGRYAKNGLGMLALIREALNKSKSVSGDDGVGFREQIGLLSRLVKAYASGDYRQISTKTIVSVLASLVYFVSPIDVIPDVLPFVGFADDIALMVWLFNSLQNELINFRSWEREQARVTGKVIDLE